MKVTEKQKMNAFEMISSSIMAGVTRRDRIKNVVYRRMGVNTICMRSW